MPALKIRSRCRRCWCRSRLQRDAVTETFELYDEAFGDPGGVGAASEEVAAEILVGGLVVENVVAGDQDRVRDRGDRLLVAAASFDLLILRAPVGIAFADRCVGGLDQRGAE